MRKKYELRWRKQDSYDKNKSIMEESSNDNKTKRKFENNIEDISSLSTNSGFKIKKDEVIIKPGN